MNAPAFTLNADSPELTREASVVLADAQALTVTDAHTYALAGEKLRGLKGLSRKITDWFEPLVTAANRAHKELTTRRADTLRPIEDECRRIDRQMSAWKLEQDRLARAEAARLAREEQERQKAIALEEAVTLEAQGMPAEAAAVVEQAIAAPAPFVPVAPAAPKVEGLSHRSVWKFEVVDKALIPAEYLVVDEKAIGGVVRALKGNTRIPGVRVFEESTVIVRNA